MTKTESLQHKLERVRAPRVRITYDLELGGSVEQKEIPFVVGVLADLSGKQQEPRQRLRERRFVEIDRDNCNKVMESIAPRLAFKVENRLTGDGSLLGVQLRFRSLDDFRPERVAAQVEPLARLLALRRRLSDLLNKLDGNERLDRLLQEVLGSSEALKKIDQVTAATRSPDPQES